MFFRLWVRAPRMTMASFDEVNGKAPGRIVPGASLSSQMGSERNRPIFIIERRLRLSPNGSVASPVEDEVHDAKIARSLRHARSFYCESSQNGRAEAKGGNPRRPKPAPSATKTPRWLAMFESESRALRDAPGSGPLKGSSALPMRTRGNGSHCSRWHCNPGRDTRSSTGNAEASGTRQLHWYVS